MELRTCRQQSGKYHSSRARYIDSCRILEKDERTERFITTDFVAHLNAYVISAKDNKTWIMKLNIIKISIITGKKRIKQT